jgi:hypothetical protein
VTQKDKRAPHHPRPLVRTGSRSALHERFLFEIARKLNRTHADPDPPDYSTNADYDSAKSSYDCAADEITYQERLRGHINKWLAADCCFDKWSERNTVNEFVKRFGAKLERDASSGGARIVLIPTNPPHLKPLRDSEIKAQTDFIKIITGPLYNRINTCARCAGYYVRESLGNKKYCSRQCASGATAAESTRKRLRLERERKIERTRQAIQRFKSVRSRTENWKVWVANRAGVSQKWITQALNRGDLPNARSLEDSSR